MLQDDQAEEGEMRVEKEREDEEEHSGRIKEPLEQEGEETTVNIKDTMFSLNARWNTLMNISYMCSNVRGYVYCLNSFSGAVVDCLSWSR